MSISIKSEKEVEILKEGGKRHSFILEELAKAIKPGVSSLTLNEMAEKLIAEKGDAAAFLNYRPKGARRKYPASLCVSVNEEIVHGIPNENPKILKDGDVVTIDLGLSHEGLITDSAITVGVGSISDENKKLIRATEEALWAGIWEAKAGNHIGDIGFAIESVAKKEGFSLAQGLAGHGVGYSVHEEPFVPNVGRRGDGPELKPGMVLAIEPMLVVGRGDIVLSEDGYTYKTKDKSFSAHFEHTVVVTDGEPIVLTAK